MRAANQEVIAAASLVTQSSAVLPAQEYLETGMINEYSGDDTDNDL